MPEYIKREKIRLEVCSNCTRQIDLECQYEKPCGELIAAFLNEDPADVAPVVHGEWMYEERENSLLFWIHCSVCGWKSLDQSVSLAYHYCPNCGTKMDGGEKND